MPGFAFLGVQAGKHCFCGNSFGRYGLKLEVDCRRVCTANEEEICGGGWRNSIYTTGARIPDEAERQIPGKW